MKQLLSWLYEFNRGERIGVYSLVIVISLLIVVRCLLPFVKVKYSMVQVVPDFELYKINEEPRRNTELVMEKMPASIGQGKRTEKKQESIKHGQRNKYELRNTSARMKEYELFSFDPNTLDSTGFVSLGLSNFVIKNIMKWRSTGAKFTKPKTFSKVFGLSDQKFEVLLPFITIPKHKEKEKRDWNVNSSFDQKSTLNINLNSATAQELKKIKGIGEVLSTRIVKYRNMLGGFHNTNQIKEVYGISDSLALALKEQLYISNEPIKIYVNTLQQDSLTKHPYINWKTAKSLCRYRTHHGNYHSINDLYQVKAIDSNLVLKLKPYLSFVE